MKKTIFIVVLTLITAAVSAQTKKDSLPKNKTMYQDVYPVFITKDLKASKEFYIKWFGYKIIFESGFFILLTQDGEKPMNLGFLSEDHPSSPPSSPAMSAQAGVFLTLQVADAKSEYERLKKAGLKIHYHLKNEDWGQKRFGIIDPNGMYVDVVEQTEPKPGFWEKYPAKD